MTRASAAVALLLIAACLYVPAAPAQPAKDDLETRKLQLDVERLENETSWDAGIRPYLPLASVLVAVGVAITGGLRWRKEQNLARKLRIEEQVADNLKRIVDGPDAGIAFSGRTIAALRNLNAVTSEPDAVEAQRDRVTETLTTMVDQDLTKLDTPSKARFPAICVSHWPPYEKQLKQDTQRCRAILARYRRTLAELQSTNGTYFSALTYREGDYDSGSHSLDEASFALFQQIVAAYGAHLDRLPDGLRTDEEHAFGETLHNRDLPAQIFASGRGDAG